MTSTSERRGMQAAGGMGSLRLLLGAALLVAGCSMDGLLGTDDLPPDVTDPEITRTPEGARAAYHGTLAQFRNAFGASSSAFTAVSGLLSDELEWGLTVSNFSADMRHLPEGEEDDQTGATYSRLQRVRGQAGQAIGLLTRYAPGSEALAGHVYALQAYAEIFLAELFCSGVPLSTLDFDGDFTYRPGSTTEEVYTHALALLDTAATLVEDSARFTNLARVGRARALLALGRFADAAAAVAEVPDDYSYEVSFLAGDGVDMYSFARIQTSTTTAWQFTVGDHEGANGLDYVSSGDPRTHVTSSSSWRNNLRGLTIYYPSKYATDGSSPIVLASGVEARLIEAEAALQEGDVSGWLQRLNHLRQTAWSTIEPAVTGPLSDLTDPGTGAARVDLLFRERAFWLFLTGHRHGDLRRLIRHYGRAHDVVYPAGAYHDLYNGGRRYGSDVDAPVPLAESISNPHFTGCVSRGD